MKVSCSVVFIRQPATLSGLSFSDSLSPSRHRDSMKGKAKNSIRHEEFYRLNSIHTHSIHRVLHASLEGRNKILASQGKRVTSDWRTHQKISCLERKHLPSIWANHYYRLTGLLPSKKAIQRRQSWIQQKRSKLTIVFLNTQKDCGRRANSQNDCNEKSENWTSKGMISCVKFKHTHFHLLSFPLLHHFLCKKSQSIVWELPILQMQVKRVSSGICIGIHFRSVYFGYMNRNRMPFLSLPFIVITLLLMNIDDFEVMIGWDGWCESSSWLPLIRIMAGAVHHNPIISKFPVQFGYQLCHHCYYLLLWRSWFWLQIDFNSSTLVSDLCLEQWTQQLDT